MATLPEGWPRITPAIFYDDPAAAIAWLTEVFGFQTRMSAPGPDGEIMHAELELADGLIMIGSTSGVEARRSPKSIGGSFTQSLYVFVDDVEAHCERARAAGAKILAEPTDQPYGHRMYQVEDCEGHPWGFAQRVSSP